MGIAACHTGPGFRERPYLKELIQKVLKSDT